VSAGDAIVACGDNVSAINWNSASDGTNTYNLITNIGNIQTPTTVRRLSCYLALNVSAGSFTPALVSASSSNSSVSVFALRGIKTSSALVTSNASSGLASASTQTCNTLTPTAANQALVGAVITANSSPTDISPHSSETEITQDGARIQLEWRLTPNTTPLSTSWNFTVSNDGAACGDFILDLAPTVPTFTSGPTWAKVNNTTMRATFTSSAGSYTARCGVYVKGASAPTAAQVAAGTNAHGTANAATTGSSQTLDCTATDSPAFPAYDPYIIIDNGGTYSAVPATTTTCLDPPTNFVYDNCSAGLTSLGTGSPPKNLNDLTIVTFTYGSQSANFTVGRILVGATSGAYGEVLVDVDGGSTGTLTVNTLSGTFQNAEAITDSAGGAATTTSGPSAYPDIATGDILVVPTTVSPSGAALAVDAAGQYSYTATGRQTALNGLIYDDSVHAYMSVDLDFVDHDVAPSCVAPIVAVAKTNVAMTSINLNDGCTDTDGDSILYALISGTLPAGLSFNGTTGVISGTPTVENEAGVILTFYVYDGYGGSTTVQVTIYPITSWTLTDCTTAPTTSAVCSGAISTLTVNSVLISTSSVYSGTVAAGIVISQNPAAGAQVAPGDIVTLTVSLGASRSSTLTERRRRRNH
jgi:hypothetical protein